MQRERAVERCAALDAKCLCLTEQGAMVGEEMRQVGKGALVLLCLLLCLCVVIVVVVVAVVAVVAVVVV